MMKEASCYSHNQKGRKEGRNKERKKDRERKMLGFVSIYASSQRRGENLYQVQLQVTEPSLFSLFSHTTCRSQKKHSHFGELSSQLMAEFIFPLRMEFKDFNQAALFKNHLFSKGWTTKEEIKHISGDSRYCH